MKLGTTSLLALSISAALFAAACKKKEPAATGSGTATATASGTGSATGTATAAPAVIDAAEAAPAAVDAAEAAPAAAVPPELKELDDTVAPILAMADQAERTKTACKALDVITTKMAAVRKNPPAGVDAAAWQEIAERMASQLNDFQIECAEGDASDTGALSESAKIAKELHELLAKKGT
jgi:hypothetical protein